MNYQVIAFWSQIAAFVAFLVAIVLLWKRAIEPAVVKAQDASNRAIAEAERHRDEAVASLDVLRAEITGAERDGNAIRERAAAQAQREHDAALAEARDAGDRQIRNAEGEFERAVAAGRARLRDEIMERALVLARAQARERVTAPVEAALVDRFAASLERTTGAGRG
jgi:F-type H+-transporting ATPase subunit b